MIGWEWAGMIGSILVLDLALSGDNALVLGATAAGLPQKQRWYALIFGGAGAIVLRILFSSIATIVLNIPWLQTAGAVILIIIAVRLLAERAPGQGGQGERPGKKAEGGGEMSFRTAALTILVADVTMSLDNVLAVGAAANGDVWPIVFGLLISIAIIICGSALVAAMMHHLPWLLDLATLVLAWTSATMIHDDLAALATRSHLSWLASFSQSVLPLHLSWLVLLLFAITGLIVLGFNLFYRRKAQKAQKAQKARKAQKQSA